MSLEIKATGKLVHVFRSSRDGDPIVRYSLQLLSPPSNGEDSERYELSNYKLPKGTNYIHWNDKVGSELELVLAQWSQDGRSGFYIADVRNIKIIKEPASIKQAKAS